MPVRKKALFALFISAVIWGFSPPIIKYSLKFIDPTSFLFYRCLLVSILLFIPLVIKLSKIKLSIHLISTYLILGFLATPLNLYLWFVGLEKTTAIDATVISNLSPLLILWGGVVFLKEKVAKSEKIGLVIALGGSLAIIIQPLWESNFQFTQNLVGNLIVFTGTAAWAVFTILFKKHPELDPFILTAMSFFLGAFLFMPLVILNHSSFPSSPSFPGIIYMSIFGSIVAYFAFNWGLSKVKASETSIFTYIQLLFAIPLAAVWLGEKITPPFLLGATLIISGVFISGKK